MAHPYPPLRFGSELIRLTCPACREPFGPGAVVRALVDRTTSGELAPAFVHVDCANPNGAQSPLEAGSAV